VVIVNPVFLILSWALPLRRDSCLWGIVIGSTSSEEEEGRRKRGKGDEIPNLIPLPLGMRLEIP